MSLYKLHDFSGFKVERNVQIPERDSNSSRMRKLIASMEEGDSIEMPIELLQVAQLTQGQFTDKFKVREYKDKNGAVQTFRIWKLSPTNRPEEDF